MDDKIIVSNQRCADSEVWRRRRHENQDGYRALIAADAKRGIKSRLVYLDNAAAMKSFKGRAVDDRDQPTPEQGSHRRDFSGHESGILDDPRRARRGAASGHGEPGVRPADDPDKYA